MTNLVASFVAYARDKGIVYTLKRSMKVCMRRIRKRLVSKDVVGKRPIDVMTSVEDVVKADFVAEPYVAPKKVDKAKLNIGWVLSPISIGSGGQHTIARFAKSLQERGHNVTFFIYESISQQPADYSHQLLKEHFDIDVRCLPMSQSGMIEPRMATMLGFIATDAGVAPDVLAKVAKRVADASFNRITVDGDTSTND